MIDSAKLEEIATTLYIGYIITVILIILTVLIYYINIFLLIIPVIYGIGYLFKKLLVYYDQN